MIYGKVKLEILRIKFIQSAWKKLAAKLEFKGFFQLFPWSFSQIKPFEITILVQNMSKILNEKVVIQLL